MGLLAADRTAKRPVAIRGAGDSIRDFYRDLIAEGLTKGNLEDLDKFIYGEEAK
jgi:hypothetical protein